MSGEQAIAPATSFQSFPSNDCMNCCSWFTSWASLSSYIAWYCYGEGRCCPACAYNGPAVFLTDNSWEWCWKSWHMVSRRSQVYLHQGLNTPAAGLLACMLSATSGVFNGGCWERARWHVCNASVQLNALNSCWYIGHIIWLSWLSACNNVGVYCPTSNHSISNLMI